jgi:hypothetical protein
MTILAVDFGGYGPDLLNDVANQYINAINTGFGLIKGDVTRLLNVLIILSIFWSAALWALSEDHVIAEFARKPERSREPLAQSLRPQRRALAQLDRQHLAVALAHLPQEDPRHEFPQHEYELRRT